jgi:hypothetical protein
MYKLNPKVISVGAKGNKILRDHNAEYPASFWDNGVADELVEKGFLVLVEPKAETAPEPKLHENQEPKAELKAVEAKPKGNKKNK